MRSRARYRSLQIGIGERELVFRVTILVRFIRDRDRQMLLSSDRTGPEAILVAGFKRHSIKEIIVTGLALCGFREHFEAIASHCEGERGSNPLRRRSS
jgi:hypothetical protein